MKNIGLHEQLSYYFRSSLFQPTCNCRQQYTILDGYVTILDNNFAN